MSHTIREICQNYILGFCPDGPNCHKEHIKNLIKSDSLSLAALANFPQDYDWVDRSSRKDDETSNSKRYPAKANQS